MHKRNLVIAGLLLLATVHIAVAANMIYRHEMTLKTGDRYKFRTEPVDPYDAFRGRYVALNVDRTVRTDERFYPGQTAYVVLAVDSEGFATLSKAYREAPAAAPYIETTVSRYGMGSNQVWIEVPFDRYYMNEALAPAAEHAYRQHSRTAMRDACITVRVRDGFAVLEELYIAGKPIAEFLAENSE